MAEEQNINGYYGPNWRKAPKIKPGRRNSLKQSLALQEATFKTCMELREDTQSLAAEDKSGRVRIASALAGLVKAWDILEDRKRVLRNRPLPGSLRPDPIKKQKQAKPSLAPISQQDLEPESESQTNSTQSQGS